VKNTGQKNRKKTRGNTAGRSCNKIAVPEVQPLLTETLKNCSAEYNTLLYVARLNGIGSFYIWQKVGKRWANLNHFLLNWPLTKYIGQKESIV